MCTGLSALFFSMISEFLHDRSCLFSIAGSDVSGRGVHLLLLPDGLHELPPAAGPARLIRPCGRAPDPGGSEEAEAGRVREHGVWLNKLQPAGVLCGRHAARLSGTKEQGSLLILPLFCLSSKGEP